MHLNVEATSTSTLLNMVHLEVGATILSLPLVESYNCPNIKIIRLIDPIPTRKIKLFILKDRLKPPKVRTFINHIPEFMKDL
ncbi:LysR family transcriptional regulator substrate-binding protein [Paenibacillus sp. TAF58]